MNAYSNSALEYIHSVSWRGSKLGLERTTELLALMGNPQDSLKFIHIAGTNGKGSTAAMLASIMKEAGYKTGLYTSPYIHYFNERMQINGAPIDDGELERITAFVRQFAEKMKDHPTEFELVTAIAMQFFKDNGCQIVVLEVGMGGRLDSTNVIKKPELVVITSIGLDHTKELGSTVEKIAAEKAGIIKVRSDVVLYDQISSVDRLIDTMCRRSYSTLHRAEFGNIQLEKADIDGQWFTYGGYEGIYIPLLGDCQLKNAAVVMTGVRVLKKRGWNISDDAVYLGMSKVRWPARFEVMSRSPVFIADGGHNVQCAEAFVENLERYFPCVKAVFVMGVLADKDYRSMVDLLIPHASRFYTVTPGNKRALSAAHLADYIRSRGMRAEACESVSDGVNRASWDVSNKGLVCAFGSLYMMGEVRDCFKDEQ